MQASLFSELKEKKPLSNTISEHAWNACLPNLNDLRDGKSVDYLNSLLLTGQVQRRNRVECITTHFKRLQFGQVYSVNQLQQGVPSNTTRSQFWNACLSNVSDVREGKSNRHSTHQQKTSEFQGRHGMETATIQFNQLQCGIVSNSNSRILREWTTPNSHGSQLAVVAQNETPRNMGETPLTNPQIG